MVTFDKLTPPLVYFFLEVISRFKSKKFVLLIVLNERVNDNILFVFRHLICHLYLYLQIFEGTVWLFCTQTYSVRGEGSRHINK